MTSEQSTPGVMPILTNEGLQPILSNSPTPHLPKKVPIILRETPKMILIEQNLSSPPNTSSSPHTNTHTPLLTNKRCIVLSDGEDTNRSKFSKLEDLPSANIEDLKKQIEAEEAKLKLMLQLQSQKNVTTHSPQLTTVSTPYLSSPPNNKLSKPIIIHATDGNKNSLKPTILINPDNHSKHSNILISREISKQNRLPTIIHGSLHTDKIQNTLPLVTETLSPNDLEPEEFKELQDLQVKVRNIAQRFSIPLPSAKHSSLFLSKHNHPKKHLSKMIERKLIKAQLPPTNREVWPIIPYADTNFQYAVGLEEAVLYVAGETGGHLARDKKNRVVCLTCGSDFGSGWHRSKSSCFCESCASAQQMKEHRSSLVAHLNGLMRDVEIDERDFDRFSELLAKQQSAVQQRQPQSQQESYIVSHDSDHGQFHVGNSITLTNTTARINPGTVIHQKQDIQYLINTSDANNTKLQPVAGYYNYIQQNTSDKKNGQATTLQLRNSMYTVDHKTVLNTQKK